MEITWRDKTITCEEGTTLFDISKQVEKEYEFPIIVAKVDGVIQELYHEVIDGTTVSFCTTKDSDGKRAYIRGMSMLLLKAIQEEKAFKGIDLEYAVVVLMHIFEYHLLVELGLRNTGAFGRLYKKHEKLNYWYTQRCYKHDEENP